MRNFPYTIMLKIIIISLIALTVITAFIFGVGLWHFRKQTIYSPGIIYDNTDTIEQTMRERAISPAALYFQTIANEWRVLYQAFSLPKSFMLLFK